MSQAVILMGVSGCGKSTIGTRLSRRLDWEFIEGDEIHPAENVRKMASGIPLDDTDRLPWLKRINALLLEKQAGGASAVVSCSALKRKYREILAQGVENLTFVYLAGDFETIFERMQSRDPHYMKADMLRSQFDALEPPDAGDALVISIELPVEKIVEAIIAEIKSGAQLDTG
jgi:gluconokinase